MDPTTTTLPALRPRPPKSEGKTGNQSFPYREDCWSDGETSALVTAWGERFVAANRGHLHSDEWFRIAAVVNSRAASSSIGGIRSRSRRRRSDVQCKNRVDTLKKKYKAEKSRLSSARDGDTKSSWIFFARMDAILGTDSPSTATNTPSVALCLPPRRRGPLLSPPKPRTMERTRVTTKLKVETEDEIAETKRSSSSSPPEWKNRKRARQNGDRLEAGARELAKAIEGFGAVYERVEMEKLRRAMEMEKKRMEFAKEVELQRMGIFVESQVQIEKFRRSKKSRSNASGDYI